MRVNLNDPRLSPTERMVLQRVHDKLSAPRQPLPEGYKRALDEVFGSCGEGDRDRWQPEGGRN